MHTSIRPLSALLVCLTVLAVVGCSGTAWPGTALPAPSEGISSSPRAATASLTPSITPPAVTPTPLSASNAPVLGCPTNSILRPNDTYAEQIPDVDGDGLPDAQWYAETSPFSYGITTASGATFSLPDGLPGPNRHSGWSARLADGVVVTVLDDSRGAALHAIVDCSFVTPLDVTGSPYEFDMQNLRGNGTGVGCRQGASGVELVGLQTTERGDGLFDVVATRILVSVDGLTAVNGERTSTRGLLPDDLILLEANTSSCAAIPVAQTSGR